MISGHNRHTQSKDKIESNLILRMVIFVSGERICTFINYLRPILRLRYVHSLRQMDMSFHPTNNNSHELTSQYEDVYFSAAKERVYSYHGHPLSGADFKT